MIGRPRSPTADRAILDAAVRLLVEQGYDAMTVEGVAAAAGVGKTTIYRRYPNKRELVVAALGTMAATLSEPDCGDARRDLIALVSDALDLIRRTGVGFTMVGTLLVKERDEPLLLELFRERIIRPRLEAGVRILRRGVERGELRPEIEPEAILTMLIGSIFSRHLLGMPEGASALASVVDTVWRGIATERASR